MDDFDAHNFRRIGGPISPRSHGERADIYLAAHFPFLSRAGWQKRMRAGSLLINGQPGRSSRRLRAGDKLSMYHPPGVEPWVDEGIQFLSEHQGIMGIFKPAHLPMHENGPYRQNTFARLIKERFGSEWSAVHRLDFETSGVVLCAACPKLRRALAADIQNHRIHKEYIAIVRGVPELSHWRVEEPIGDQAHSRIRIKKWVVADGGHARTDFWVLDQTHKSCDKHSLLRAVPKTGRTNQIRIHAAWSGHVLLGDKLYHPDESVFIEYHARGNTAHVIRQTGFKRLCLHATRLRFVHPESGRDIEIYSALPKELKVFWNRLKHSIPF